MKPPYDPQPAARNLAKAWQTPSLLEHLPENERPQSVAEGYAVQSALALELDEVVAGYKLGLSSAIAMERSGLGRPARGFMVASRIQNSGATLQAAGQMLVEVEVAFVIGRRVAAGERVGDVEDVISEAHLAI